MDIRTSKIELVKLILNIDSDLFLTKVIEFIQDEKAGFWNELTTAEKSEIKLGIDQLTKGKRRSYEDMLK